MRPRRERSRAYQLYGLSVRSEWPLPYPEGSAPHLPEVGLLRGASARFSQAVEEARTIGDPATWDRGVPLADGGTYLRWCERFEFLISSDGTAIAARSLDPRSDEAFHTYLLGQALSFALIKQGFDPLHATAVTIEGGAVAFLGDSGYGKSSLGAAFLQAGHQLLTDDLLVLSEDAGGFTAHAGPPRIKLFPEMARGVLGPRTRGTPLASTTRKLSIFLDGRQVPGVSAQLRNVYVLAPPASAGKTIRIQRLSKRRACLALISNTFNTAVTDPRRLTRQLIFAASVASTVPVKQIAYPRALNRLPDVRAAILTDLARDAGG